MNILLDVMAFRDLINKQDIEGNTALYLAAIHEHYEILEILAADDRVDQGVVNKKGMTAVDIFNKSGTPRLTTSTLAKVCTKHSTIEINSLLYISV